MAQTTLNVRMDEDVKKGLEEFCNAVGMNVSVAVNMFAKAVIREQRLPFDVAIDPFFNEANMARLRRSIVQMEANTQARKLFQKAFEDAQAQSIINGTDNMTLDEINAEIQASRQENLG